MNLPPIEIDRETFLSDHFSLPPLPLVANRVLEAVQSGRAGAAEIAAILAVDPGLVAQILKIVNSAYYALPTQIADVKHAVAYLGLAEVERLTLAAAVMDFAPPDESEEFQRFWHHSFYTALISKLLAREHVRGVDVDDLYSAALLHDVGKLVYMKFFPEHYGALARSAAEEGMLTVEVEERHGWPTHMLFGSILCERWRLPLSIKRACERHEPEQLEARSTDDRWSGELQLIGMANLLANLASSPLSETRKDAFRLTTLRQLDCNEHQFLLLMGQVYELKTDVDRFLLGM